MPGKYDLEFKPEAVRTDFEPEATNRDVKSRLGIGVFWRSAGSLRCLAVDIIDG